MSAQLVQPKTNRYNIGMPIPLFAASIMAADAARLGDEIAGLDALDVDILHWDVMDGHFVPNMTFGPHVVKALRDKTNKEFDVHLMVTDPAQWIGSFLDSGADNISFHIETVADPLPLIKEIKAKNCKAGLAFNPATPLSFAKEVVFEQLDRVLIMTVNPGFGGQAFIGQSDKIGQLQDKYPHLDIMVDGGVNLETASLCAAAGATSLVSGSAFFKAGDRAEFITALKGRA